jgi:hypothetical protein
LLIDATAFGFKYIPPVSVIYGNVISVGFAGYKFFVDYFTESYIL